MGRKYHYGKDVSASFFRGLGRLVIECEIDHGKGTMAVKAALPPELLASIARFAVVAAAEPDREHHSHCWWHVENPDREYPCETCSAAAQANGAKWAKRVDQPRIAAPSIPEKPAPKEETRAAPLSTEGAQQQTKVAKP